MPKVVRIDAFVGDTLFFSLSLFTRVLKGREAGRFLESQPVVILITSVTIVGESDMKASSGSWFPVDCHILIKL